MTVDNETVRRIARLARIAVKDEELPPLAGELNAILGWVEQLNEVDVTQVPPMTSAVETTLKQREDDVTAGHIPDDVLKNAPESELGFFVVPKVVE